jgi:hypothetical protein
VEVGGGVRERGSENQRWREMDEAAFVRCEEVIATPRNGNGYVPDGYWPPVPAPARSKSIPSGYPRKQTGKKFISYPHPTGNSYPTGIPYPKIYPSSIEI